MDKIASDLVDVEVGTADAEVCLEGEVDLWGAGIGRGWGEEAG
jgi:hypothetical protein